MCKILCVSASGYYKYRRNLGKPSKDDVLSAAMQDILNESPYNDNYGAPRMQLALLQRNLKAGIRRITRIMREHGWIHKPRRKPKGLTHATTEIQEKENLIFRFTAITKTADRHFTDSMSGWKTLYFSYS